MFKLPIRRISAAILVIIIVLLAHPVGHIIYTSYKDSPPGFIIKPGTVNDASRLNETAVDSIVKVASDPSEAEKQLSSLIRHADGRKISIAGAQHSMGGHTIYPGAIVIDMKGFNRMELDSSRNLLTVGSGALWSEVIPFLDKRQKSVMIMQSNNSFSVGGSISVNCHGWQPNLPPIAHSVVSFRLIDAAGVITTCSRTQNRELFSLALGGYGLFGIILEVKLQVINNTMYRLKQYRIKSEEYVAKFNELVNRQPGVGMVYGRINVNPDQFMKQAILSVFDVDSIATLRSLAMPGLTSLRRNVFRGSANSDYGKNLRWRAEKLGTYLVAGKRFSRNSLMNEGVDVFENTAPGYTDILHEYFIPTDSVGKFIKKLETIIPKYKVDLLNITLRNVKKDEDSYLAYAREDMFGFVMLFNQPTTTADELVMTNLTQRLIRESLCLGGDYYLPYRLHATKEQMHVVYPKAKGFFNLKKKYDPDEVFQNLFYAKYK